MRTKNVDPFPTISCQKIWKSQMRIGSKYNLKVTVASSTLYSSRTLTSLKLFTNNSTSKLGFNCTLSQHLHFSQSTLICENAFLQTFPIKVFLTKSLMQDRTSTLSRYRLIRFRVTIIQNRRSFKLFNRMGVKAFQLSKSFLTLLSIAKLIALSP